VGVTQGVVDPGFWRGKRVLLTGHTGFKGGWMSLWLSSMGARVHGFGLAPETSPSLHALAGVAGDVSETIGDLRDPAALARCIEAARPQIVIHMAAQPLVRRSVREPVDTFAINVMGTVNLLEILRNTQGLEAILVVTTDKVYENPEHQRAFSEHDPLGGHDPYSASKAACEIVVASYARTWFDARNVPVATARGGNVIGGGDFSEDRIIPDIFRSMRSNEPLVLRNPEATRPWQHVLDCTAGYLLYAQALATGEDVPRALNFGPMGEAERPVRAVAEAMQAALGMAQGYVLAEGPQPREMRSLALDSTAARASLGFRDRLVGEAAIRAAADWYLAYTRGADMRAFTLASIKDYQST
jgi:CDP-glucose 4,6-dehydratase